jgi:hypothetical protein
MKTIEISDEMYDQLIELATEMTTQDPRSTRMPHMFQIRTKKKVYDWGLNGDFIIWVQGDMEIETFEELMDFLKKNNIKYPSDIEDLWKNEWWTSDDEAFEGETLKDFLSTSSPNLEECSYSWDYGYENCFFTAKACKEHIERNHYNYNEPTDYLNHAWRNPEMELISKFLCGLVGKEILT